MPPGLRRVVLATCGAALAAGSVTPAVAAPAAPAPAVHPDRGGLRGLPLPDRASGGLAERRRSTSAARRAVPASRAAGPTVTVTRGDTLWALAARRLPAAAGVSDVAAACRALYAANRAVVGADPDRIVPGQVLHLPDPTER